MAQPAHQRYRGGGKKLCRDTARTDGNGCQNYQRRHYDDCAGMAVCLYAAAVWGNDDIAYFRIPQSAETAAQAGAGK